jgi:catechol 2,3-dioxygenase-like lactoylglutathione lyase family enzyme
MIGFVTIGARDLEASGRFYDIFFGAFGHERKLTESDVIGYGPKDADGESVYVCSPYDGNPASSGNGMMIAFNVKTEDAVRAAHKAGLEAGGTDEGAPGYRPPDKHSWYGAYLRDPTGNKVCVFFKP